MDVLREVRCIGLQLNLYDKKLQITDKNIRNYGDIYMRDDCPMKENPICIDCELDCFRKPLEAEAIFYEQKIQELEKIGRELMKDLPLWRDWIQKYVKGAGVGLTLRILGYLDFNKAKHPSSFWAFAGYTSEARKTQRYNHSLKGLCVRQAMSFLGIRSITPAFIANPEPRLDGGYARFFKMIRAKADEKYPDWTRRHKLFHAMSVMMKLYLSHIFIVHNFLTNNIASVHYAAAHLGHDYIYMPVIDAKEKPDWWHDLAKEYVKMGIKPVEI